jgi:two-component system sensor histidine kinase/response regulator
MPGMDGFTLVEQIKKDPVLAGSIIMMLSSADQPSDAARCRALGVANYLTKPIKQSDLLGAIVTVLRSVPGVEAPRPAPASSQPVLAPTVRRLHILLAEDNPVNQALAVRLLEKRGHTVVVAGDGQEALDCLEAEPFDLVLMDVQMPILGGIEATRLLRERESESGAHIPVIAVTARAMSGDREECLKVGFDDYIAKPIQSKELYKMIDRLAAACGTRVEEVAASPDPAPHLVINRDALFDRMDGDAQLLHEMIGLFLKSLPRLLREIREAIATGDATRLNNAAHELKGSTSQFSAEAACEAAVALENMSRRGDLTHAEEAARTLVAELERLKIALAELTLLSVA